jgi:hypothetical protein
VYKTILLSLITSACVLAQSAKGPYFVKEQPVNGGSELITVFGQFSRPAAGKPESGVPLLSVLRDSLGDGETDDDRLRYVWILTSTRPTALQRAASAISIAWFRAGTRKHVNHVPTPVLDLASPAKGVWTNVLADSLQATEVDPLGMAIRASTRSYRGNLSDYRELQIFEALGVLDGIEQETEGGRELSDAEFRELYSRLSLSDHLLGGLVRKQNLSNFYDRENSRIQETLGHNWELLRQRAEASGLYFEPLGLPGDAPTGALLWVAQEDLKRPEGHSFEGQFLNIANPWTDERLQRWTGYREIRYLDADNRPVVPGTPGARPVEMIPLAFYSLDHPRVPLLLADFRDQLKPKRSEMVRHGSTVLLTGILGITRFTNWPFFFGETTWTFVRGRHGVAVNRSARLRAYSEARAFLAVDTDLDPKLNMELRARLDHLALNPLENGAANEAKFAREQYSALIKYAQSPSGLITKLERDRRKELASYTESRLKRTFSPIGHFFNPQPRIDTKIPDPVLLTQLEEHRRAIYHERFLDQLLASSPRPEVVDNMDEIRRSIDFLSNQSDTGERSASLIAKVFSKSEDPELLLTCLRALQRLNQSEARNELRRLAADPRTGENWRQLCLLYLNNNDGPLMAGAAGGQ